MMSRAVLIISLILIAASLTTAEAARKSSSYEVVASTRVIERGQKIVSEDITTITVSNRDPRVATNISEVVGMTLKRTVGKNTPIKRDYLLASSPVKKGDEILLIAKRGGIKVSTEGRAMENANVGDVINLENVKSGKIISGKLVDSSTAIINF
jgi:flagella basal body P-ring formation protein FlgA